MASFLSWSEWLTIKESNARKRAVRAAVQGTGVELPGSYAACPSTNVQAMDAASKTGKVSKLPKSYWRKFKEEKFSPRPDNAVDRWIQAAQELGDDVNSMVGHAKGEEDKLEKEKEEKKKKADDEDRKAKESGPEDDSEETPKDKETQEAEKKTWKSLRQIHKERLPQFQKHKEEKSSGSQHDEQWSPLRGW